MFKKPSDLHSCLTDERIDAVGHLIARVRAENVASADERDTGWSLGCRAYAWCCTEIGDLSISAPWLSVVDPTLRFIFKIDNVEISLFKGNADKPKKNIYDRAQSYPELRQFSLLSDIPIPERLIWAYAVETDMEGLTTNIEFFGMSESGDVVASRVIPLHNVPVKLVSIPSIESEPADLPPAPISLPKIRKGNAVNDEPRDDEK